MSNIPTDQQLDGLKIPDPSIGPVRKKERLVELAQKHGILRIAAENGLTVESASRFIETYADRIAASDFPEEHYDLLK